MPSAMLPTLLACCFRCTPRSRSLAVDVDVNPTWFAFFVWRTKQLRQMASRLKGRSLARNFRPPSKMKTTGSTGFATAAPGHDEEDGEEDGDDDDDDRGVKPSPEEDLHSPQFSLQSSQLSGDGGGTPVKRESASTPEKGSPKAAHRPLQMRFTDPAAAPQGRGFEVGGEQEWVAQVVPGVNINICFGADGFNDLKRVRFSRAVFTKQNAESWWAENGSAIRAAYNVRPPTSTNDERFWSGYTTPDTSAGKSPSSASRVGVGRNSSSRGERHEAPPPSASSVDASRRPTRDEGGSSSSRRRSFCPAEDCSWIQQDEAGVYLTIARTSGTARQLKKVRFSRDRFSEEQAAVWWQQNRQRLYNQYMFRSAKFMST